MMSVISDLNSFCFIPEARRVIDNTLAELDNIRCDYIWSERLAEKEHQ